MPVAVVALGPPGVADVDEWEDEYQLSARRTGVLRGGDARIRVEAWDQGRVAVRVGTEGWRIRSGEVQVEDRSTGSHVEIVVHEPVLHLRFGFDHHSILLEATVPRGTDLDAQTSDGAVEIPAIEGSICAKTSDGSIAVDRARGALVLSTSDGRIVAHRLDGMLEARTSDGSLMID